MEFIADRAFNGNDLQRCDIDAPVLRVEPCCLVICGGAGTWGPAASEEMLAREGRRGLTA